MTGNGRSSPREFTGRHMLFAMVGFFGVVIAVNVLMATLAGRSWTGLAVKNAYVASQHYNEVLDEARRQSELGWTSSLDVEGGRPVLSVRDRRGEPVVGLAVSSRVERATHEGEDAAAAMIEERAGRYVAERALQPGLWLVRVEAGQADTHYRREFRVIVRKES